MNIMLVAIFWFLFKKLERFPEAPDAMLGTGVHLLLRVLLCYCCCTAFTSMQYCLYGVTACTLLYR